MLVTLVGAGPGDPGLLTLNGKAALENCDVVVYDALANRDFLKFTPASAEKIYVGKVADNHALPQEGINALLVRKAREDGGKRVVRLKGGDPFIFGRGGEEALYLKEAGVPFEIVPGISSAIAVPAYAGIPLTHRGCTSSLTILTGHENPDKDKSAINWQALAASGSTLVFVMGMKNIVQICGKLMECGLAGDTPAAVIYKGSTPFQKSVFATVANLPEAAKNAGLEHPALIVIGKVVQLAPEMAWLEKKPLAGKTVVITRATEQASGMAELLRGLGASVIQFPTIKIGPIENPQPVRDAIASLGKYAWIVFTSANGVKCFWKYLMEAGKDARALANCEIAAIGPATAEALAAHGLTADVVPGKFVAESLAEAIVARSGASLKGRNILLPRAREARAALVDGLTRLGAVVDAVPVYETAIENSDREEIVSLIEKDEVDCVAFASSSTVRNFFELIPPALIAGRPSIRLAAIGPITAATVAQYGMRADIMPENYDIPGLVQAIKENLGTGVKP